MIGCKQIQDVVAALQEPYQYAYQPAHTEMNNAFRAWLQKTRPEKQSKKKRKKKQQSLNHLTEGVAVLSRHPLLHWVRAILSVLPLPPAWWLSVLLIYRHWYLEFTRARSYWSCCFQGRVHTGTWDVFALCIG